MPESNRTAGHVASRREFLEVSGALLAVAGSAQLTSAADRRPVRTAVIGTGARGSDFGYRLAEDTKRAVGTEDPTVDLAVAIEDADVEAHSSTAKHIDLMTLHEASQLLGENGRARAPNLECLPFRLR